MMKKVLITLLVLFVITSSGCSASKDFKNDNAKKDVNEDILEVKGIYKLDKNTASQKFDLSNDKLEDMRTYLIAIVDITNNSDENWEDYSFWGLEDTLSINKNKYSFAQIEYQTMLYDFIENCGYKSYENIEEIYSGETVRIILPYIINENDIEKDLKGKLSLSFSENECEYDFNYKKVKPISLYDEILIDIDGEDYQIYKSLPKKIELCKSVLQMTALAYQNVSIGQNYNNSMYEQGKQMLANTKTIWDKTLIQGFSVGTTNYYTSANYNGYDELPEFNVEAIKKFDSSMGDKFESLIQNMNNLLTMQNIDVSYTNVTNLISDFENKFE